MFRDIKDGYQNGIPFRNIAGYYKRILNVQETYRAVEALGVVVVIESLDPPVSGFDRESARHALRCEQLVPIWAERKL